MNAPNVEVYKRETFKPIKSDFIANSGLDEAHFKRECSFALQAINDNGQLKKCSQESLIKAVLNISLTGLSLNPIKEYAYLIPRYSSASKQIEAVLDPGYKGLYKLITDCGIVKSLNVQIVYEGDDFLFDYADPKKVVKHVPYFIAGNEKGEMRAAYSLATLKDGSYHAEIMSVHDIMDIMSRSESYQAYQQGKIKSSPWVTDFPEMSRKTVLKRHVKYLPKSEGTEQLEKAISLDNYATGFDKPVSFQHVNYLESLIQTSTLNQAEQAKLESELLTLETQGQASKMQKYLEQNQQRMGAERIPTTQKEVAQAVANHAEKEDFYQSNQ